MIVEERQTRAMIALWESGVEDRPRSPSDVTFGTGRHRCLGEHLAVAELSAVVDELLSRLPDAKLAPDAEIRWRGVGNTRGVESLPIVFTPEKSTP